MKLPEIKIGDLAHPEPGSFKIGPFGSSLKKEEFVKEGIPVVGIENVLDNIFIPPFRRYITKDKYKQLSQYTIKSGDILVTTMGTIGYAAVAPKSIGTMIIDSHLFRMRVDQLKVHPPYLCYAINFYDGIKQNLQQMSRGAIMEGLNTAILKECSLPLPPLTEQKRIMAILEKADRLRRLHRYVLELSSTYLQTVFLEMFGDPVKNSKRWKQIILDDICDLVRGSSPRPQGDPNYFGGPLPRLMIADITRDGIYVTPKIDSLTVEGAQKSRWMKAGSVVMAVSGLVGLPAILKVDACIHDGFVGFRNLNTEFLPSFFVYFLQTMRATSQSQAAGAIWQNLTTDQIKNWHIIHPPIDLQLKFTQIVQKYEHLRTQQREALRQAEHLFQTLLHKAFQGELNSDEGHVSVSSIDTAHNQFPSLPGIPEHISTDAYQLSLPLE
jgi:type I restriction enzyme, S subunit